MVLSEEELKKEIDRFTKNQTSSVKTAEFNEFRNELIPLHITLYEKACNFCANIITIKADPKKKTRFAGFY